MENMAGLNYVVFSLDSKNLLTASDDFTITIWELQ
jgi:WD40 repeat protein